MKKEGKKEEKKEKEKELNNQQSGEQERFGVNQILPIFGIDEKTAQEFISNFIKDIKNDIVKEIRSEIQNNINNIKESIKNEVKKELIQEAKSVIKQLNIPIQQSAQQSTQQPKLDPNSPFWFFLSRLIGGDDSSKIINTLLHLQLMRAIKNTLLADAVMDKVYKKILGKEYEDIINEIMKAFEGEK